MIWKPGLHLYICYFLSLCLFSYHIKSWFHRNILCVYSIMLCSYPSTSVIFNSCKILTIWKRTSFIFLCLSPQVCYFIWLFSVFWVFFFQNILQLIIAFATFFVCLEFFVGRDMKKQTWPLNSVILCACYVFLCVYPVNEPPVWKEALHRRHNWRALKHALL